MFSQKASQVLLPKLEVSLCDIFKCTERKCFPSDIKKYVKAQKSIKNNLVSKSSSLNSENGKIRKSHEKNLQHSIQNKVDTVEINSESESSSEMEVVSESESSYKSESAYEDEDDDDYSPDVPKRKKIKKKKPLTIKIDSRSESDNENDSDSESNSSNESEGSTTSKRKRFKKKKPFTKKKKDIEEKKKKTEKKKELSEYEKLIQKGREEKMAFLKSLKIDEIKEDIKAEIKIKKDAKPKKPMTSKSWKSLVGARKSKRSLTEKTANLSEDFITNRAYRQASNELNKLEMEAQKRRNRMEKEIRIRTRRSRRDSDSEDNINDKSDDQTKKRLIEDFLLPALTDQRYGLFLKWTNRRNYCFKIQWSTTNAIFHDYDKMKGHYHPEEKGYNKESMRRLHNSLFRRGNIKLLPNKTKKNQVKNFQFVFDAEKNKSEFEALLRNLEKTNHKQIRENLFEKVKDMYRCHICGAVFYGKQHLVNHLMFHKAPLAPRAITQGLLAGTSVQSNVTQAGKLIILLKPPQSIVKANEVIRVEGSSMPQSNPNTSTCTNLTFPSILPQATSLQSTGTSDQNKAATSNELVILLQPPPVTTIKSDVVKTEPPTPQELTLSKPPIPATSENVVVKTEPPTPQPELTLSKPQNDSVVIKKEQPEPNPILSTDVITDPPKAVPKLIPQS